MQFTQMTTLAMAVETMAAAVGPTGQQFPGQQPSGQVPNSNSLSPPFYHPTTPELINMIATSLELADGNVNNAALHLTSDDTESSGGSTGLNKRSDVPGLNCGWRRFGRCVGALSSPLMTCLWAAVAHGADMKEDSKCWAGIKSLKSNLPNDCKLCLSNYLSDD